MKNTLKTLSAFALVAVLFTVAFAGVGFDSATGTGFVGKGDAQLAFGWNNKQAQTEARNVSFSFKSQQKYDITCEWDTVTGGKNSKVIEHAVEIHKTTNVNSSILSDPRKTGQYTGYNLNGFGSTVETGGPIPAVGDSCQQAHATAVVTDVFSAGATGGLIMSWGAMSVQLENTPVVVAE
jgi:hypothetical protein